MEDLSSEKCAAYALGSPALTAREAADLHKRVDCDWEVIAGGRRLTHLFKFKDYLQTMNFVNAVARIATAEDHHPELRVGYDYCEVIFETHTVGGLSKNDFICAAKVDRLV